MITQLSQDSVAEYASDAQTIDEPTGTDYSQGVRVGRTVPAKWWNWLFSAVTKRAGQSKSDAQNMLTELQNVVTDAGIPLDGADNTQLSQAIDAKTEAQIDAYVRNKRGFFVNWVPNPNFPSRPSGYLADYKFVEGCFVYSSYQRGSNGLITGWSLKTSPDLENWSESIVPAFGSGIDHKFAIARFNNKFFLLAQETVGVSDQHYLYMKLYSSSDALNWTLEDNWQLYNYVGKTRFYACLFTTETRVGIVSTDQTTPGSTASDKVLRSSTDGSVWTKTTLTGDTAMYSSNDIAGNTAVGYDYDDGFILGNAAVSNAGVVTRLFNISFSIYDAHWAPGMQVFKLASGNFVFASNTITGGWSSTKWYTAPVTGNIPVVTERTGQDSRFWYVRANNTYVFRNPEGRLQYSTDGETFTDLSIATSSIYYLNGVFYSGKYKSTDLVNWTEMTLPTAGSSVSGVAEDVGMIILYTGSANSAVSGDGGDTWDTTNIYISGSDYFKVGDRYGYNNYLTFNAINRVIGHTLYLQ